MLIIMFIINAYNYKLPYSLQFKTQGTDYFHNRPCSGMFLSVTLKVVNTHGNPAPWLDLLPRA